MKGVITDALKAGMTMLAGWTVALWMLLMLIALVTAFSHA
jgi:hypothetical protein